jgi:hypothetical protein
MELVSVRLDFRAKNVKKHVHLETMVKIVSKNASVRMEPSAVQKLVNAFVHPVSKDSHAIDHVNQIAMVKTVLKNVYAQIMEFAIPKMVNVLVLLVIRAKNVKRNVIRIPLA